VTGGAGLLGSHLCDRLLTEGWDVLCLDSLLTGRMENLRGALRNPRFTFQDHDVTSFVAVEGGIDAVLHFASPASPRDYLQYPIHTLKVGALGTLRGLGLAKAKGAAFLLASTSEVYGDPAVSPQPETYWGNVNPVGPRGVYDEAKRYAEAMAMAYHRVHGIPAKIARIFNTYGPRLRADDGRAVPTFIFQALNGQPLTVHGDGAQTRSLCYVDDLVEGLWRLLSSDLTGPVNLGNPEEVTINELAELVRALSGSSSEIVHVERPVDDPSVRCPDVSLARRALGWGPSVPLEEGLARTIDWARRTGWVRHDQPSAEPGRTLSPGLRRSAGPARASTYNIAARPACIEPYRVFEGVDTCGS
jgi:dTDP-glucose 4,6-dehydratase